MPPLSTLLFLTTPFILLATSLQLTQTGPAYPNPTSQPGCTPVGDCITTNVKWGHPSTYAISINSPSTFNIGLLDFTKAVQANCTSLGFNTPIGGSVEFAPSGSRIGFHVIVDNPSKDTVTYGDVSQQVGNLGAIAGQITQAFDGLLWDKVDASRVLGSYSMQCLNDC